MTACPDCGGPLSYTVSRPPLAGTERQWWACENCPYHVAVPPYPSTPAAPSTPEATENPS